MASSTFRVGQTVAWTVGAWRGHRARVIEVIHPRDNVTVKLLSVPPVAARAWKVGSEMGGAGVHCIKSIDGLFDI